MAPKRKGITIERLQSCITVREVVRVLRHNGYPADKLDEEIKRIRHTRNPRPQDGASTYGSVDVEKAVSLAINGWEGMPPIAELMTVKEAPKEERKQVRRGGQWLEVKSAAKRLEGSPLEGKYKTASEVASFASDDEIDQYISWLEKNG